MVVRRILFIGLLFGISVGVAACSSFQRRLIYFPPVHDAETVERMGREEGLERWSTPAGKFIGWKRESPARPVRGQWLILHGNAGAAFQCGRYAGVLQQAGSFDVFIVEYPGYADRAGKPSERELQRVSDEAFRALKNDVPTYLLGESLGTGVAAYIAGIHSNEVAGVVLLAPFSSLTDVARAHVRILPIGLILCDRFPSERYLRTYHGPVSMLIAGGDTVVPMRFGRRLFEKYAGPKQLWEFPHGNHGTVMEQPVLVWGEILAFLEDYPAR